ncbi:MAG TPA: ASCH domain-containing protein [Patescibacteria group bacterium]|nr:ASCH domain-containing protein [Patescibacteria group bacterium]
MKTLKFASHLVPLVLSGEKTSTWRLFDEKDLSVGDELTFINKATGEEFAKARVTAVREKRLGDITSEDEVKEGNERFRDATDRLRAYKGYYGDAVSDDTVVKMLKYELVA